VHSHDQDACEPTGAYYDPGLASTASAVVAVMQKQNWVNDLLFVIFLGAVCEVRKNDVDLGSNAAIRFVFSRLPAIGPLESKVQGTPLSAG
jgi:hypothetical protein